MMSPDSMGNGVGSIPLTDREIDTESIERREDAARDILIVVGEALEKTSSVIDDIEKDRLLGPAITRACADLADMAKQVAADIHSKSDDERRELARACLRDAQDSRNNLLLRGEGDRSAGIDASAEGVLADAATKSAAEAMAELTEDDIVAAVNSAETILLDVEEVLRSVGKEEAEEIADVGLTVAKMFVWSLQSIHGRVTPQILAGIGEERDGIENSSIEMLDDDRDHAEGKADNASSSRRKEGSRSAVLPDRRMRVLWPPLGPAVASAGQWGADAASKKPILSVALGMALWPAAIVTSFVGAPLLAADWAVQKGYEAAQDGPLVEAAERGAANLFEVGKLYYLCSRLLVRQGWRVGQRQVERRGGLGAVANEIGSFAINRALHPVETATMACDALKWGAGALLDAGIFVKSVVTGETMADGVPIDLH